MSEFLTHLMAIVGALFLVGCSGACFALGYGGVCKWLGWAPVNLTVHIYQRPEES